MAEHINAHCSICGKGYHKCLSCNSELKVEPWKVHTDTSEHYKIFQIIRGYSIKVYSKEEAKEKLKTVDLSDIHELRENIQKIISEIMFDETESLKQKQRMARKRKLEAVEKQEVAQEQLIKPHTDECE